jgi:membrane associated rhomboid family serine protease
MSQVQFTRPSSFPPVVKNLIIINVLVYIAQVTIQTGFDLEDHFALHDIQSFYFKPYQLLTHMFMHGGFTHLLFNMIALWMFGSILENYWGPKRFLTFYLLCGLGAALLHLGVLYLEMKPAWDYIRSFPGGMDDPRLYNTDILVMNKAINSATLGASGAIFGCLAAFGYLFPNSMIYMYFMFPMKAKWFVLIYGALELFMGIRNSAGDSVAHFAHLGGAITGFIIVYFWNKRRRKTLY